jgi:hypothetical protein
MTGYYDYVLGLIPAALIGVPAFLNMVGLSLTAALPAGAAVAAGLIAHAMFIKGPVADEGRAAVGQSVGSTMRRSVGSTPKRAVRSTTERSVGQSFERADGPSDDGAVDRSLDRYSGRSRTGGASD